MLKLSKIQQLTGFTLKNDARNLADWLREARQGEPVKIDNEIAYEFEFVKQVLQDKQDRIAKRYPHTLENVLSFLNTDVIIGEGVQIGENIHISKQTTNNNATTHKTEKKPTNKAQQTETIIDSDQSQIEVTLPSENGIISSVSGFEERNNPTNEQQPTETDKLRQILTSAKALLWATMLAIVIFLPFTALNLWEYIAIKPENDAGKWAVFILCWLIALIWDFSILLFAVNGKRTLAGIGAVVLFVFMSSKFNFFKMLFDVMGFDGASVQLGFVIFCIVSYTPLLLFQLTELAVIDKK